MAKDYRNQEYFDVSYGVASTQISVGNLSISTTKVSYHGIALVAGATAAASVIIYDAVGTATGNIIDVISVGSAAGTHVDRYIPVMAKYGMYLVASGTGLSGTLFYGPRG